MGRQPCCEERTLAGCSFSEDNCYYKVSQMPPGVEWMDESDYIDYLLENNSLEGYTDLTSVKTTHTKPDDGEYTISLEPWVFPITNWEGDTYGKELAQAFVDGDWGVAIPMEWSAFFGDNKIVMTRRIVGTKEKTTCSRCVALEMFDDCWSDAVNPPVGIEPRFVDCTRQDWINGGFGGWTPPPCMLLKGDIRHTITSIVFTTEVVMDNKLIYKKSGSMPYKVVRETFYREADSCSKDAAQVGGGTRADIPQIDTTYFGYLGAIGSYYAVTQFYRVIPPPPGWPEGTLAGDGSSIDTNSVILEETKKTITSPAPNSLTKEVTDTTIFAKTELTEYFTQTICVERDHIKIGNYTFFPDVELEGAFNKVEIVSKDFKYFNPKNDPHDAVDFGTERWYEGTNVGNFTTDPCPPLVVGMEVRYSRALWTVVEVGPWSEGGEDYDETKVKLERVVEGEAVTVIVNKSEGGYYGLSVPIPDNERCWECAPPYNPAPTATADRLPFPRSQWGNPPFSANNKPCALMNDIGGVYYNADYKCTVIQRSFNRRSTSEAARYIPDMPPHVRNDKECYRNVLEFNFANRKKWGGSCGGGNSWVYTYSYYHDPILNGEDSIGNTWFPNWNTWYDPQHMLNNAGLWSPVIPNTFFYTDNQISPSSDLTQLIKVKKEEKFSGKEPAIDFLQEIYDDHLTFRRVSAFDGTDVSSYRLDDGDDWVGYTITANATNGEPETGDTVIYGGEEWTVDEVFEDHLGNISLTIKNDAEPPVFELVSLNQVTQTGTKSFIYIATKAVVALQEEYLKLDPDKYRVSQINMSDQQDKATIYLTQEINGLGDIDWVPHDEDGAEEKNYEKLLLHGGSIEGRNPEWAQFVDTLKNAEVKLPEGLKDVPPIPHFVFMEIHDVGGAAGNPITNPYQQLNPLGLPSQSPSPQYETDVDATYPRVKHNLIKFTATVNYGGFGELEGSGDDYLPGHAALRQAKQNGYLYTDQNLIFKFEYDKLTK